MIHPTGPRVLRPRGPGASSARRESYRLTGRLLVALVEAFTDLCPEAPTGAVAVRPPARGNLRRARSVDMSVNGWIRNQQPVHDPPESAKGIMLKRFLTGEFMTPKG